MKKDDLKPKDFPQLKWEKDKAASPLAELCHYAATQTEDAINWYYKSKRGRRWFCRACRMAAILLTAFAGLLPLINEIVMAEKPAPAKFQIQDPRPAVADPQQPGAPLAPKLEVAPAKARIHPLYSAIALALAATLILIDRFYGFTTGWVRYVLTAQQLTQSLEVFRLEVERQKLGWGNLEPTQDQARTLVTTIQQFCAQARGTIADETKSWAAEFAEVLKQLDEQIKVVSQANQKSAIQIAVTNGDQCPNGWNLKVDDRAPESRGGKEVSVDVLPGMHTVRVDGQIGNKPATAQQAIKVAPGEIGRVTLTLA